MRLSDGQVAEIRARHGEGVSCAELATTFQVSRRQVERIVAGDQRRVVEAPAESPVLEAVEQLLGGLDLDSADMVLAETARTIAGKLDGCAASDSAAAAAAVPGLSRELAALLGQLAGRVREPDRIDELRAGHILRKAGYPVDEDRGNGPPGPVVWRNVSS